MCMFVFLVVFVRGNVAQCEDNKESKTRVMSIASFPVFCLSVALAKSKSLGSKWSCNICHIIFIYY